jgi:hypothetical protein
MEPDLESLCARILLHEERQLAMTAMQQHQMRSAAGLSMIDMATMLQSTTPLESVMKTRGMVHEQPLDDDGGVDESGSDDEDDDESGASDATESDNDNDVDETDESEYED